MHAYIHGIIICVRARTARLFLVICMLYYTWMDHNISLRDGPSCKESFEFARQADALMNRAQTPLTSDIHYQK